MKRLIHSRCAGYTLIEAVVATAITATAMSMAVAGFSFMLRGDRLVAQQTELDMDARTLIERIRNDLWMTGRREILLYPPDSNTYTAISMPRLSGSTAPALGDEGQIIWDETVIYHLYEDGDVFEVRRTVFESWLADDTARREQLADVVESGEGDSGSSTQTLIENLVDWKINITANRFDAYAAVAAPEEIELGSALIKPGANTITFRAVGKNRAGRGSSRHLGVDQLFVTPSGLPLEGEWMGVVSSSGSTPTDQNMGLNEAWQGNARLWFPASADNHEFTLSFTNDSFDMRNYSATADEMNSVSRFNHTIGGVNTFGLRLDGSGVVWQASDQAGAESTPSVSGLIGKSIKVIIRGNEFSSGGTNIWLTFSLPGASVGIYDVYFELENSAGPSYPVTLTGSSGGIVESAPIAASISRDNNYVVRFKLSGDPGDVVSAWSDADNYVNSYIDDVADTAVYALSGVRAGFAPEGTYMTEVIDTTHDNPDYASFTWNKDAASSAASVVFRVRGSDSQEQVDKQAWQSVMGSGLAPNAIDGLRYFQVEASLKPDSLPSNSTRTPELYDFNVRWTGEERYVALSGIFSKGPDHGIYEVEVNGDPILRGVTVDLTVYKDVNLLLSEPKRLTARAFAEVVPKNTGATPP